MYVCVCVGGCVGAVLPRVAVTLVDSALVLYILFIATGDTS